MGHPPSSFIFPKIKTSLPAAGRFCPLLSLRLLSCFFLFCILMPAAAFGQARSLVTAAVDTGLTVPLAEHHPLWANEATASSAIAENQSFEQMKIVLARPAERQLAFEQYLASQLDPQSPNYHHWLTAEEIGNRFGPAESDIEAIRGWLTSQGLHVNQISPDRMILRFGGTAANINNAFGTELRSYQRHGAALMAPATDPTIPAALAPAIQSVRGLFTIGEHPLHSFSAIPMASEGGTTAPEFSSGATHYMAPLDFNTIYDVPSAYTGAGYTIGIVSWARVYSGDLSTYKSLFGVSFPTPNVIIPTAYGGVDPGAACSSTTCSATELDGQQEATLDVDRAGSTAPGATLLLVASASSGSNDGIGADAEYIIGQKAANILSISFGACEASAGKSSVNYWDALFQTATGEGISVFVSSGDAGAQGCEVAFQSPTYTGYTGYGNSPNYICSSSYATCVGGTEFADAANYSTYWNTTNTTYYASAKGYIPEGGWNEGSASSVTGSGGGVSNYVATPGWQVGNSVLSAAAGRYTPDISFSSSIHDGYFICMAALNSNCPYYIFGGTSAAAPSMAGVAALLDQKMGSAQGNLNPSLYGMAQNSTIYANAYHDATVSSSGVSNCALSAISLCNNSEYSVINSSGTTQLVPGFQLQTGYDEVTGLGSLDVTNFLSSFTNYSLPTVTVTPTSTSYAITQSNKITITVSPLDANFAAPTGTVKLTSGSYSASATLSSGTASITLAAGQLSTGTHTLTATYTPDTAGAATYQSASGSATVTVTTATPAIAVSPSPSSITTVTSSTVTVTATDSTGYSTPTGAITLSNGSGYSASGTLAGGTASFSVSGSALAVGSNTLTATYAPDSASSSIYASANGSTTVTVAIATPTVTVTPSSSTLNASASLPLTIVVSGGSGATTPTGSVVLTSGSYTSAATTLSSGSASITIPYGKLAAGNDPLTATYTPNAASASLYASATGTASATVSMVTPTLAASPATTSINSTAALPVTLSLTGANSVTPTGTVKLTSGSYASAATTLASSTTAGIATASITIPAGSLASGSDALTAVYTPDSTSASIYNSASNSAVATVTVTLVAPTVSLTPGTSTLTTVQTLPMTITVASSGNATPTGTVKLTSGSYASSATTLTSGTASITIPAGALSAGSNTITATYTPDAADTYLYATATATSSATVSKVTPSLTVAPSPSTITSLGTSTVTVTVAYTGSTITPTGTVYLTNGSGYTSSSTALSAGSASIAISGNVLANGANTLTAYYTPDSTTSGVYNNATGTGTLTIGKVAPTMSFTASPATINGLTGTTLTVSLAGGSGNPTVSGTVAFSGAYTASAQTLSGGTYSVSLPAGTLALGSDTISATYTPDTSGAIYYTTSSGATTVTVNAIQPTVSVSPTPGAITTMGSTSVGVTVAYSGGSTPTGSVVLSSGGYTSSSSTLSGGAASFSIAGHLLAAGTDTLTVTYTPDSASSGLYGSSTGSSTVTVTAVAPTVSASASPSAITTQQSTTVTVGVAYGGGVTPTGSIVLSGGNYTSASTLLSGGATQIPIPAGALSAGSDTLTATYTPDSSGAAYYSAASGTVAVTVSKVAPSLTVTPASTVSFIGSALSVTVYATNSSATPTGSITLTSGNYSGSGTLSGGSTTLNIPAGALIAGSNTISATYTPDSASSGTFSTATGSGAVTVSSYSISGTSVTLSRGATTGNTSTITLTPLYGFTGSVALSAAVTSAPSGAQYLPTFSFGSTSPVTISSTGNGTATLTINTTAATTSANQPPAAPFQHYAPAGGAALAGLILLGIPCRRRAWRSLFGLLILALVLAGGLSACSATAAHSGVAGTTSGTYTITLTGTTSGYSAITGTITLTVQ